MKKILIVGGAGFIGTHVAMFYLRRGEKVHVADNLSRNGSRVNLELLEVFAATSPGKLVFHHLNIRVRHDVETIMAELNPDLIVHTAAQVAVTTSVANPRLDFEINAVGTFNLLEAYRNLAPEAFFIYASTNKVYGGMHDVAIVEEAKRYRFRDLPDGADETCNLDFHSPYGCSKGAADQYVRDYARIYGLRTTVFRQSCIYGTHQFGVEDQGWIAWFIIARLLEKQVTIYGSGKQVRDILWVEDMVEAYHAAWTLDKGGSVFNLGGGSANSLSLIELTELLDEVHPSKTELKFGDIRPGDQPVYIANSNLARRELNWSPKTSPKQGIEKLYAWLRDHRHLVEKVLKA
ncbi:MAG: GDP-mannose 4,6-dehydratase [Pirellulaceae bacterium]|nr:GDP-mannose 4,6-dehydratase [Pirellulaceae bacterium]